MSSQPTEPLSPKQKRQLAAEHSYPKSCGDPVLADSCCTVVALSSDLEEYGRGFKYHAHLMDNGKVLVEAPDGGPPYLAKRNEFVRVVENHHVI